MRSALVLCLACLFVVSCASRSGASKTETTPDTGEQAVDTEVNTAASSATGAGEEDAEPMRVTLKLSYRQKIPLPDGAAVAISLVPVASTSAEAKPVFAETTALDGRQVPLPIGFIVDDIEEDVGSLLRLDASVMDSSGQVLWTLPEGVAFEAVSGLVDLGELGLVPDPSAVVSLSELSSSDWMIARLKGDALLQTSRATVQFGEDGRITGNASCNAFTGSFKLNAGMLTIAPLAMTRKACVPPLMEQEAALIKVLQSVSHVRIEPTGLLVLQTEEGESITARQGSS